MAGLGQQGKRKAEKRAADLCVPPEVESLPAWRPSPEECVTQPQMTFAPPDGSLDRDRIIVRMDTHAATDQIVEFAVVQQAKHRGSWHTVSVADSCHNTEVHLHRHGRSTDDRIGESDRISEIRSLAEVGKGYDLAYNQVIDNWTMNRARWLDG